MSNTTLRQRSQLRWLKPGLRVKRWLLLMGIGALLFALAAVLMLREAYRMAPLPPPGELLTPGAIMAVLAGIGAFVFGFYKFNQSLVSALRGNDTQPAIDRLWQQRITANGPRIVAIGGGHGLAALLSGIKQHTANITAIVTVADDGGSSGRLRREMGMLPPGDFRMCISALADNESLVTQLMQYRFSSGEGLSGHSFGNLFIAALAQVTGSFERALVESSRVLASQGRIVPSTLSDVTLCAEYQGAPVQARGESSLGKQGLPIERVWLEPNDPPVYPEALRAVLEADLIVIGPGSLWTSLMPNLLVRGLVDALRQASAPIVYVANITTERGETDKFTLAQHVDAIERHIGRDIVDHVLVNSRAVATFTPPSGVNMIDANEALSSAKIKVVRADLVSDSEPWRHHSGVELVSHPH
jgi:uncharacterized cofD-like protein